MLQLQQQLTPGLLDFDSRNSPLLSSRIPISECLQTFCFFHVFLSEFELAFKKWLGPNTSFYKPRTWTLEGSRFRFPFPRIRLGKAVTHHRFSINIHSCILGDLRVQMSTRTCMSKMKSCCAPEVLNMVKNSQVTIDYVLVCNIHNLGLTTRLCNERCCSWCSC